MKKLMCIMIAALLSVFSNLMIFADNNANDLTYINIRPKHAEALPGDDSLYYGYVNLNETFNNNNLNYSATVEYDISNVRIETGTEGDCTVDGNKEYDLKVGQNLINLTVKQSGGNSKVYTIKITREQNPSDSNSLKWLSIVTYYNGSKPIAITPKFDPEILNYDANVDNDVSKINISCADKNGEMLSDDYSLKTGQNKIEIPVTSDSGIKQVYTFNISRAKSADNTFFSINIDKYDTKNIKFDKESINYNPDSLNYPLNVTYDVASINIGLTSAATSQVNGHGLHSLKVGANKINITVTAENGDKKTYTITVNRAKPSAELNSLQINQYYCGTDQKTYTLDVDNSTAKVNIIAIPENRSAIVTGNGEYKLKVGTNKFTVTVKSVDGTVKKYPIVINRLKESKAKVIIIWTIIK